MRVEIVPVRQQGLVKRTVDTRLDLATEEVSGGADHVVARIAGHHLGLERLIGVIGIVDDLDARARLEILDGALGDVIGPVVDVQHFGLGPGTVGAVRAPFARGEQCEQRDTDGCGGLHPRPGARAHLYSFTMMWRTTV
jgi:hypothetical protein